MAGFLYFDARADDARSTLTLARTAAIEFGAAIANYTPVVNIPTIGGTARGARVQPDPNDPSSAFDIRARVVVNATGVWADAIRALDEGTHPHSIRPAKGVHVTVPAHRLPCDIAAVIPVPKDRRAIFVVPWPHTDLVYLGTTDTDYTGPLDDPACTPEDVDYLLEAANNITSSRLTRADAYWGLVPAPAPRAVGPPRLRTHGGPVAPGAHRADLARGRRHRHRRQVDDLPRDGGRHRRRGRAPAGRVPLPPPLRDQEPPAGRRHDCIGGATRSPWPSPTGGCLGATAASRPPCSRFADGRSDLLGPAVDVAALHAQAELVYAAREEMAQTLDDVLARRTRKAMIQKAQATMEAAPAAATLIAPDMGWSAPEAAEQAARFTESCEKELLTAGLDLR